jgi:hypothetical protein
MEKRPKKKLSEADLKDRADAIRRSKEFQAVLEKAQAEIDAKNAAAGGS